MNSRPSPTRIEPLEARIAPALVLQNPLVDFIGGAGKSTASIDLSKMFDTDPASSSRTRVNFVTNVDIDAITPGLQAGVIELELFDDLTPLTVQNFLNYVNGKNARGDYDNTIIHRTANFLGTSDADFIQGGGFEFPKLGSHIPTGLNLINEFNESLSNVRGTIAMGKIGGDPNSASSEWFINANDNSSIFDEAVSGSAQGYTVFGHVLSGLDIVDTITRATTRNLTGATPGLPAINGAFGAVPLQNFTTGTPTADQYFRITDAFVVPGDSTGITYSASIAPVGGAPAGLLKTSVKGSTLNLVFSGRSGEADITVTGKNAANETTTDTFRVTLGANLAARITSDGFLPIMVPGDSAAVRIAVSNAGSANFSGPVKVEYFLSQVLGNGSADPDGTFIGSDDLLFATVPGKSLSLKPGASATISTVVSIPAALVSSESPTYRILAKVTPLSGTQLGDLTDDDVARLSNQHVILNQFGRLQVGTGTSAVVREGAVLKTVLDDGDAATTDPLVSFSVKGAGNGRVSHPATGDFNLTVDGTNDASKLFATTTKGQRIALNDLTVNSALGTADLGTVDLDGFASFSGGVKTLRLGDLAGPGSLTIGAFLPANTTGATISLRRVSDYGFESSMPVASLTAVEWLDTGGLGETLSFLSLGKLNITGAKNVARGDLQANVNVTGSVAVGSISVAGLLEDADVTTVGNIGSVVLGGIHASNVFAGTTARPTALGDLFAERTISAFAIKGISGFTGDLFVDSQVAAQNFGTISVQKVAPGNAGTAFGFVADVIKSYNRVGGARLSRLDAPASLDVASDYRVTVL